MIKFWEYEIKKSARIQEEALLEKELEEYEADTEYISKDLELEDLENKSINWQPPTPSIPNIPLPQAKDCKSFPLVADPNHKDSLWSTSELPDIDPKTQNYEENLSYCTTPIEVKKWEKVIWHPSKKKLAKRGICQHSSIKYAERDAKRMLKGIWDLAIQGKIALAYLEKKYPYSEEGRSYNDENYRKVIDKELEEIEILKEKYPDNRMSAFVTVCKDPKANGGFWAMFNQKPKELDTILCTIRIDTYSQTLNTFQIIKEEHNRAGYTPAWAICLIGENETIDLKRYNWSYKKMVDQVFQEYDPSLYKIGFVEIPDANAFSCDVEYSELVEEYETHKAHHRFIH